VLDDEVWNLLLTDWGIHKACPAVISMGHGPVQGTHCLDPGSASQLNPLQRRTHSRKPSLLVNTRRQPGVVALLARAVHQGTSNTAPVEAPQHHGAHCHRQHPCHRRIPQSMHTCPIQHEALQSSRLPGPLAPRSSASSDAASLAAARELSVTNGVEPAPRGDTPRSMDHRRSSCASALSPATSARISGTPPSTLPPCITASIDNPDILQHFIGRPSERILNSLFGSVASWRPSGSSQEHHPNPAIGTLQCPPGAGCTFHAACKLTWKEDTECDGEPSVKDSTLIFRCRGGGACGRLQRQLGWVLGCA
jgi:hypothetical protein